MSQYPTKVFEKTSLTLNSVWFDSGLVFVVIPTFNEAENLPALTNELLSQPVQDLQIVFVDDNSPDGTGDTAEWLMQRFGGQIHVIHRPAKLGLGSAYRTGFQYALQNKADYIIQMDADFSHSPAYIPVLLNQIRSNDVLLGSRYTQGGQLDPGWSPLRYWLSWWANSFYVRVILGLKVRDATGGFKCWKSTALQSVLSQQIGSNGYIFQVEMEYLTEKMGFRVNEIPIYFEDRRKGTSKMSTKIKIEAMWRTWYLRWQYRQLRPEKGHQPYEDYGS